MISYAVFCLKKKSFGICLNFYIRRQRQIFISDSLRSAFYFVSRLRSGVWIPQQCVSVRAVSYTHLRAHETRHDLVCRILLEKKKLRNLSKLLYSSAASDIYK